MPAIAASDIIRRLVRLVPHESLGDLVLEMVEGALAAPPAAPTPHAPSPAAANGNGLKRPRGGKRAGSGRKRKAARPTAEANGATAAGEHASNGTGRKGEASAFWEAAAKLDPAVPWRAAADRLGINRAMCQDAHKSLSLPPLPPGLSIEQATAAFA